MSQAERIARIHFILRTKGTVTLAQLKSDFEVSRATIMRDIELLRDRLGAPIEYDAELNAYRYAESRSGTLRYPPERFDIPGMWLNSSEAYALLTALNIVSKIDPGGLMPYIGPLRRLLKDILCERSFDMKGFHKKVGVELPKLGEGDPRVTAEMMRALVDEVEAVLVWKGDDDVLCCATGSLQRFVLSANGWEAEFTVGDDQRWQRVSLILFTDCTLTDRRARILPEFSSDSRSDHEALRKIYRG